MLTSSLFGIPAFVLHRRFSAGLSDFTISNPRLASAQPEVRHD